MTYSTSSRVVKKINFKLLATLLVLAVALTMICALTACKEELKDVSIEVSNAEELRSALESYQGDYSEKASSVTIKLTADIDLQGVDWSPIGSSYEDSFRGVLDGANHKIKNLTLSLGTAPFEFSENVISCNGEGYEPTFNQYMGFFGFISNAEISNLTLEYNAKCRVGLECEDGTNIDFSTLYIGGLTGYAYGNCKYNNVSVVGSIDLLAGLYGETNRHGNAVFSNEYNAYVGGVVGYAMGNTTASGIASDVVINVGSRSGSNGYISMDTGDTCSNVIYTISDSYNTRFGNVEVGGILGYVRPIDITATGAKAEALTDCTTSIRANIAGENVFCGGLVGSIYNAEIAKFTLKNGSSVTTNSSTRGELGGMAGLADSCAIDGVYIQGGEFVGDMPRNGKVGELIAVNIGGVLGYATNATTLSNVAAHGVTIDATSTCVNYAGGIVGILDGGKIDNVAVQGTCKWAKNASKTYYGGAVGKAHAKAEISNVDISFKAPKTVVGEVSQKIVYQKILDESTAGSDEEQYIYIKDEEKCEPKYYTDANGDLQLGNYVDDVSVTYDISVFGEKDVYESTCGTEKTDNSAYADRFDTIISERGL